VKNDRHYSLGDAVPRHPITGIGRCCARSKGPFRRSRATEQCDELTPLHVDGRTKNIVSNTNGIAGLSFKIGKPQADNMQGLSAGGFY